MNYRFDGLMGLAQQIFEQHPLSGHLFLFVNRNRDRLKILFWDHDGLTIFYKRLEAGTFQLPKPNSDRQGVELDDRQGVDLRGHRRRRKNRQIDWDKLPQIRHEHDLPEEEKNCSCCGRRMDCIGEDVTRELELQPAKLEAHVDEGRGLSLSSVVRSPMPAGSSILPDVDRRYPRHRAGPRLRTYLPVLSTKAM